MGITVSRDDLCNRDLNQRRKIEELQYRVIEYQREADQVIECTGEIVNPIEKLLSSGCSYTGRVENFDPTSAKSI